MTFELQDQWPLGECPCQALGKLHRFAAAGGECHTLGARNAGLDALRDGNFQLMLCPVAIGPLGLHPHRLHHARMVIAKNIRPPRKLVINVLVPVNVNQACAMTVGKIKRHRSFRPHRAADATRQRVTSSLE
jgi:hypothetical protein